MLLVGSVEKAHRFTAHENLASIQTISLHARLESMLASIAIRRMYAVAVAQTVTCAAIPAPPTDYIDRRDDKRAVPEQL